MPDTIRDGTGGGYLAEVDSENRLKTTAVQSSVEHHINHDEGEAYNFLFEVTTGDADVTVAYMKNANNKDIVVEGIYAYVSAACELELKRGASGTRNAAVTETPVNLNAGSNQSAAGTFESGADLGGGAATLDGNEVAMFKYKFIAESATKFFNFDQDIILPPNQTMTVTCDTNAVVVQAMIPFNYHDSSTHV
jgi:hypothetical protein